MEKLCLYVGEAGQGDIPDFEDGEAVASVAFGADRVANNYFEIQRFMGDDPHDDQMYWYLLHGDFLHGGYVASLSVRISRDSVLVTLPSESVRGFQGIGMIQISHGLSGSRLREVRDTLRFMSRNLMVDIETDF